MGRTEYYCSLSLFGPCFLTTIHIYVSLLFISNNSFVLILLTSISFSALSHPTLLSPSPSVTLPFSHPTPLSPSPSVTLPPLPLPLLSPYPLSPSPSLTLPLSHPTPLSPSPSLTLPLCHPTPLSSSSHHLLPHPLPLPLIADQIITVGHRTKVRTFPHIVRPRVALV